MLSIFIGEKMSQIPNGLLNLAKNLNAQQATHYRTTDTFGSDYIPPSATKHRKITADSLRWMIGRQDNKPSQYLQFWVNPADCNWKVGTRSSVVKTYGGAVHFQAPLYTRYDLPILTITFQSGITMPGAYDTDEDKLNIPPGIGNFYRFIHLIDEPNIMTNNAEPNYINILYSSPLYKHRGLWLQGFFDENGVTWADNAETPNMVNGWTANFIVFESNPPLDQLRQTFEAIGIT